MRQERAHRGAIGVGKTEVRGLHVVGEATVIGVQAAQFLEATTRVRQFERVATVAAVALRDAATVVRIATLWRFDRGTLREVGGQRLGVLGIESKVRHPRAGMITQRRLQELLERRWPPLAGHEVERQSAARLGRRGILAGRHMAGDAAEFQEAAGATLGGVGGKLAVFERLAQRCEPRREIVVVAVFVETKARHRSIGAHRLGIAHPFGKERGMKPRADIAQVGSGVGRDTTRIRALGFFGAMTPHATPLGEQMVAALQQRAGGDLLVVIGPQPLLGRDRLEREVGTRPGQSELPVTADAALKTQFDLVVALLEPHRLGSRDRLAAQ